jgi:flagellar hook-length control protein FliK
MKTSTLTHSVTTPTPTPSASAPRSTLLAQTASAAPPDVVAPLKSQAGTPSFAALMNKLHASLPTPHNDQAQHSDERHQLEKAQARQGASNSAQNTAQNSAQNSDASRAQKLAASKSAGANRSANSANNSTAAEAASGSREVAEQDDARTEKATGDDRAALWAGLLNAPTADRSTPDLANDASADGNAAPGRASTAYNVVSDPSNPGAAKDGQISMRGRDLAADAKAQDWQTRLRAAGQGETDDGAAQAAQAHGQARAQAPGQAAAQARGSTEALNASAGDSPNSVVGAKQVDEMTPSSADSSAVGPLDFSQALASAAATPGAAPAPSEPATGHVRAHPGSAEFASQLGAQLSTFVRNGVHHARLELNPTEMGPLTVQIQLDGHVAQVNMSADNATTRFALEQAMPVLASSLRDAGVTLAGGGVFEQVPQSAQSGETGGNTGSGLGGDSSRQDRNSDAAASGGMHHAQNHTQNHAQNHTQSHTQNPTVAPPASTARRRGVVDLMA